MNIVYFDRFLRISYSYDARLFMLLNKKRNFKEDSLNLLNARRKRTKVEKTKLFIQSWIEQF